jgi:peptidoglycan hydrolase CwlO-like protein
VESRENMNRLKRKRKIGDLLESKWILALFIIIAVFLSNTALKMYSKSMQTKEYLQTTEKEFSNLQGQLSAVSDDLDKIYSDTGFEKEVREKFNLAKEGEKAIMIIEEELPLPPQPRKKNLWERIKSWVSS